MFLTPDYPNDDVVRRMVLARAWRKKLSVPTVFPWSAFKRKPRATIESSADATERLGSLERLIVEFRTQNAFSKRLAAWGAGLCAVVLLAMFSAGFLIDNLRIAAITVVFIWVSSAVVSVAAARISTRKCYILPRAVRVVRLFPWIMAAAGPLMPIALVLFAALAPRFAPVEPLGQREVGSAV